MRNGPLIIAMAGGAALWLLSAAGWADDRSPLLAQASLLQQQAEELYQRRQYEQGVALARHALALREQVHGMTHQDVAESLALLAQGLNEMGHEKEV
ncbi:MAG: hypothetical protein KGJ14_04415, partial [Nitrospirota bacterium]|nr:hypothetical protein [Nitrospirota bacterium]